MCVIAVIDKDSGKITDEQWNNCWDNNPDGFGVMWSEKGKVKSYKSLVKEQAFEAWKKIEGEHYGLSPLVLHFRIGTQGNGIENCHPFRVSKNLMFCHNGIIRQFSGSVFAKTGKSDTRLFNDYILKYMKGEFYKCNTTMELIESFVSTDKLVFLNSKGEVSIANPKYGTIDKESKIWFSNGSYDRKKVVYNRGKQFFYKQVSKCAGCGSELLGARYNTTKGFLCYDCYSVYGSATESKFAVGDIIRFKGNYENTYKVTHVKSGDVGLINLKLSTTFSVNKRYVEHNCEHVELIGA